MSGGLRILLALLQTEGELPGGVATVAGQLCTPKDVLARQVPVRRVRAGDLPLFSLAGAYAWNISHQ